MTDTKGAQQSLTAVLHRGPAIAIAVASAIEATIVIGPAGRAMLHLPTLLVWDTWFLPAAVTIAGIIAAWTRRAQPDLHRATRHSLVALAGCLAVVAVCCSMQLHPEGGWPAALTRGLASGVGLLAVSWSIGHHSGADA